MSHARFSNIRVLLAEPDTTLRAEFKARLAMDGFTNIVDTGNLGRVYQALEQGEVDLLIGDTSMPEGDLSDTIAEMRNEKLGPNPFVVTVTLVSNPTAKVIRKVIDSGTDDILIKPFAADDLITHVENLTLGRKKFVVTTDYTGPDRRNANRPGTVRIEQNEVPNPLRIRMTGQMNEATYNRTLKTAIETINVQKVERHAFQIEWLLDWVADVQKKGGAEGAEEVEALHKNFDRLNAVATDLCQRVARSPYAHMTEMCMTLRNMTNEVDKENLTNDDARLLSKLAENIGNACCAEAEDRPHKEALSA